MGHIQTHGQCITVEDFLGHAEFIGDIRELLADLPYLLGDHARVERDGPAIEVMRLDGADVNAAGSVKSCDEAPEGLGIAVVHQRIRGDPAAIEQEGVGDPPAVAELEVEVRPKVIQCGAAAVADIVIPEGAARARNLEVLHLLAVVGVVQLVEAGIRLSLAVHYDIGEVGIPLILVAQVAIPEHHRAAIQIVLQGGRHLSADVGRILRVTHAVGHAVEAADAAIPSVDDLAADEGVDPLRTLGSRR